eukprot:14037217-Alexandrium_andersonii.AAC.1
MQVNVNFACAPHRDEQNRGPSTVAAFGRFSGGALFVEQPGGAARVRHAGTDLHGVLLDIRERPVVIDGAAVHA